MASTNHPKLIAAALTAIYPMYLMGAVYIVYPVFGWYLISKLLVQRLRGQALLIHPVIVLWLMAMFCMLIILIVGHVDWQHGLAATIKSTVGWAKGWALIAIFLAAGALMTDTAPLIRAACIVGRWTLFVTPFLLLAFALGLPDTLYVSPLRILGGSTAEYFTVSLYEVDPGFGIPRLRLFAPWAPAIGLVGNVLLLLCSLEGDKKLRLQGIVGALLMILLSLSRLGWVVAIFVPAILFAITNAHQKRIWVVTALFCALFAVFGTQLLEFLNNSVEQLKSARSESTIVRQYLADIAISRWQSEAFWWGHGRVEAGPHLVQYMMIGSHHTWYGLLFVKGLAGIGALAIPLVVTLLALLKSAQKDREARIAFGIVCVISLYSFGENLEVLAYLYWPGLIFVGSIFHSKEVQHA